MSTVNVNRVVDASGGVLAPISSVMRNRIINGAMVIDQRNAGASVTPTNGQYTLDRWRASLSVSSKYSVQQNAGSVTPPAGFVNYLGITSLSAYTVGVSENFDLRHFIEGYNTADLGWGTADAKTVTLSFWVRSSLTGTFGGSLRNAAGTRSYPFTYSISAADTWEQKSLTIVGETTGTWGTTNGTGIQIGFGLGVGSTFSGTAGAWASANFTSATGATSVVGTNGATWYVTGVQLEVGTQATSFEYRQYQQELALCQRYYARLKAANAFTGFGSGAWFSTTQCNVYMKFPQTMRVVPTMGFGGNVSCMHSGGTQVNITGIGTAYIGTDAGMIQPTGLSGATTGAGTTMSANNDTNAYLDYSAEL